MDKRRIMKWFYPLQEIANKRFEQMYPGHEKQYSYQIVDRTRVVEQATVFIPGVDNSQKEVLVLMINNGVNGIGTLLMYELKFVASN